MTLSPYTRALGIGAVAGLRSFTAPAVTLATGDSPWTGLVTALAAGEVLADKLPFAPSRLSPPAIVARLVSGGACGGEVALRNDGARVPGALLGAVAAIGSAWVGFHLRRWLTVEKGLPGFPVAAVEDAIAIFGARAAVAPSQAKH